MEKIKYAGWDNCVRLANDAIELIATTDVGPRIIRFGFIGGKNLFKEYREHLGKTGGDVWRAYGGHRLWHAPEADPRTYFPDNNPIRCKNKNGSLVLTQPKEETTGIIKEMEIKIAKDKNHVRIAHRLENKNLWEIKCAVWCLSVMACGGRAIFPQEPFKPHPEYLLPARPLALWHYTDMKDPRWIWGTKFIQLKQDTRCASKQKCGMLNTLGWAAYTLGDNVFIKTWKFNFDGKYPDFGCNNETYTDPEMLEVETLSQLEKIPPGGNVEHIENWFLFKKKIGEDEKDIEKNLLPLVNQCL